jgi:hypothetical protein
MEFTTDWFSARVPEISASVSRLDAPHFGDRSGF